MTRVAAILLAIVPLAAAVPFRAAQQSVWGQCGGAGWEGPTTCEGGSTCVAINSFFSHCTPAPLFQGQKRSSPQATPTISGGLPGATSHANLNLAAHAKGKLYFGSATDNPELNDTQYVKMLDDTNMFGQLTPANSMKWFATEPEPGVFNFTGGDVIRDLAFSHGKLLRAHNLVWHSQLPDWLTSGNFTPTELEQIIVRHVTHLVSHYKGQPYAWDVVNEPLDDGDGGFRQDIWSDALNSSYIGLALRTARANDPHVKLYINDFNIEGSGSKSTGMQELVRSLQAEGSPIDGIGIESHMIVGEIPDDVAANMAAFTELGIEVAITELDVRMTLPATAALLEQQKADYNTMVSACVATPKCVGVTVWDWTDKFSWVPGAFAGEGAACPWDENLEKKPAFDGIANAFGVN